MAKRARPLADHKADTRGGRWAGIPHCVMKSEAYRTLGWEARAVLNELVLGMNGYNNGRIGLSQRQLAHRLDNSNFRKIGEAISELILHGLVAIETEGVRRTRMARE